VLTGSGEVLAGTLLVFDGEELTFSRFAPTKRPDCPVCGQARPSPEWLTRAGSRFSGETLWLILIVLPE